MDGRTAHTPTNQSNVNKTQVDTIDGLVPLVPIALSRLGVASERAALKKDIKASFFLNKDGVMPLFYSSPKPERPWAPAQTT